MSLDLGLSAGQRRVLDLVCFRAVRSGTPIPARVVRMSVPPEEESEVRALLSSLTPQFLHHDGREPNDTLSLTPRGLFASSAGSRAQEIAAKILHYFRARISHDADFAEYGWEDLRDSDLSLSDDDFPIVLTVVHRMGLHGGGSSTYGPPPGFRYSVPNDIESLRRLNDAEELLLHREAALRASDQVHAEWEAALAAAEESNSSGVDNVLRRERLADLSEVVLAQFGQDDWRKLALRTDCMDLVNTSERLFESLRHGDNDYAEHAFAILAEMATRDADNIDVLERYLERHFSEPDASHTLAPQGRRAITVTPRVFKVPEDSVEPDLVAVMMPFSADFAPTYAAIESACAASGHQCLRVDEIWSESTIIDDVFALIFRASIVVSDLTGRNPNVMYETGIAHTLGKPVVPIAQSFDDLPFDLRQHRLLRYLPNKEGRDTLAADLAKRLRWLSGTPSKASSPPRKARGGNDVR